MGLYKVLKPCLKGENTNITKKISNLNFRNMYDSTLHHYKTSVCRRSGLKSPNHTPYITDTPSLQDLSVEEMG